MQKLSIPTQYTRFVPSYPFLHVSFRSLSIGELCTLVTDTLDFVPRPWGSRGIGGNFRQTGECKSMKLVVEEARFNGTDALIGQSLFRVLGFWFVAEKRECSHRVKREIYEGKFLFAKCERNFKINHSIPSRDCIIINVVIIIKFFSFKLFLSNKRIKINLKI